jgi:hypothetical protein
MTTHNERNERNKLDFTARVCAVAIHIDQEGAVPLPWIVKFLGEIDAKFPGLSFAEFFRAVRLCALARQPHGSA